MLAQLTRKLYYRELIARFGHHLALNFNLGEENTNTDAQRKTFADYIKAVDPYDNPIVMHTFPGRLESDYTPLLGYPTFDGISIQTGPDTGFSTTLEWVQKSAAAGRKWIVAYDEQGNADSGVLPDSVDPQHDEIRTKVLWGNIMAGGAGVEYYFGYAHENSDLTCQDYRSRDKMWDQSRHALEFFSKVPFWKMSNNNSVVTNDNWCLVENGSGATAVIYLRAGGTADVDLTEFSVDSTYTVKWFDPLLGGELQDGTISTIAGGSVASIGEAPSNSGQDWAVLLKCSGCAQTEAPAEAPLSVTASSYSPPPTSTPIALPVAVSTASPTMDAPVPTTVVSTDQPTLSPVVSPSSNPLVRLSDAPSDIRSDQPSDSPSEQPSDSPSKQPSGQPSLAPVSTVTSPTTISSSPVASRGGNAQADTPVSTSVATKDQTMLGVPLTAVAWMVVLWM
jgi:Putative collagen-binding domain of a collagenase